MGDTDEPILEEASNLGEAHWYMIRDRLVTDPEPERVCTSAPHYRRQRTMMRLLFTLMRMRRLTRLYRMFTGGGRGGFNPHGRGRRNRPHRAQGPAPLDEPPRATPDARNRNPDDHQP